MLRVFHLVTLLGFVFVMQHTTPAAAKHCKGDYRIESESDLDAVEQCESIAGDLTFSSQVWLKSIDLPALTSVAGTLEICDNKHLKSLDGLSNLMSVDGYLWIHDNAKLSQYAAERFAADLIVGGWIDVYGNGTYHPRRVKGPRTM